MTGPAGDALELALALLRMPAQRQVLRERPLPADIDRIIPIAAGSREAIAEAAQSTGESEALILEAVRFYLQEVLFFPDADAYRILAVAPDAAIERIQQNHRQLQRWLHPDRRGGDLESGFASRVNQAWNTLRSDARRQAYDATLQQPVPDAEAPPTTPTAPMGWHRIDAGARLPRWQHAWPLAALLTACALFALLLLVRPSDEAAPGQWRDGTNLVAAPAVEADRPGGELPEVETIAEQTPLLREMVRSPQPATPEHTQPANPATTKTAAPSQSLAALMPIPAAPRDEQARDATEEVANPVTAAEILSSRASQIGEIRKAIMITPEASVALEKPARGVRAASALPIRTVPHPATDQPQSARSQSARRQSARRQSAIEPEQLPAPQAIASTAQSNAPLLTSKPVLPSRTNTPGLVEQVRLARQRADEVTAFLSDPQARTPPVWNDPGIQMHAEGLRSTLQAGGARKRIALQQPDWRISSSTARLQAAYRCTNRCSDGEHGVLRLQMAWRNGMWLVRELEIERAP